MTTLLIAKTRAVRVLVALTALAGWALAQGPGGTVSPAVQGNFQTFGSARLVTGGVTPDTIATDLTSNCGAQPYSSTCYNNTPPFTYSGVAFTLSPGHLITLANIKTLSTDYNFVGADCGGGSPRFVISTNTSVNFEGYFGPPPNFTNCYYGWLNTGNLTMDTATRWVVNNGNTLMSWSQLAASYGSDTVTEIDIVLDGGWSTPKGQDVMIDDFTVNNKVLHAK
jgi:hypothetical protein